jgi:hypothetical protein
MKLKLSLILILVSAAAFCQQKVTITIKGDSSLEKILPSEMMFAFPEYKNAKIFLKNGSVNSTRININLYTKDILFLNKNNQVMVLAFPEEIRKIVIDSTNWIPVEGATGEEIFSDGTHSLIRIRQTSITDSRKESGFGGTSGTAAARSVTSYTSDNRTSEALAVGEYDFETTISYMLLTDSKPVTADSRGFKKVFPEKKKEIDAYLKANKVNFNNEKDLISFLKVCLGMIK